MFGLRLQLYKTSEITIAYKTNVIMREIYKGDEIMDNNDALEDVVETTLKSQFVKMIFATAVGFMAHKAAENVFDKLRARAIKS